MQVAPKRPSPLLAAAHFTAIWALAFAQPLFELLGRNTVFFVARGNGAGEILAFALIFTLAPFLIVWAAEALLERIHPTIRWWVHLALMAAVSACLFLQLIGQVMQRPAGLMIAAAIALAVALTWLYANGKFMRSVLDVLTPAPLVILALFLIIGPTSKLVMPDEAPAAVSVEIEDPAPVVMVVFDELPLGSMLTTGGEIDGTRFPAFAEVASQSTWYRNATTVAGFTSIAVPTILTGRPPQNGQLPIAADQPESLFTLLGGSYDLRVREDATQLCPADMCPGAGDERTVAGGLRPLFSDLKIVSQHLLYPAALRTRLPDISETFGGFAADVDGGPPQGDAAGGDAHVVAMALAREVERSEEDRVAEFTETIGAGSGPALNFIHIQKPHYPWRHLPDGQLYSPDMGEWIRYMDENSVWQAPEAVTDIALQRHLLETGYTDALFGQIIDRVKQEGIWDEALLVVVADHGGAMIPGQPRRNPTTENLGQIAPIPLMIKAPGQREPEISDANFCTADLLPEVAAQLGIEYPWPVHECPAESVVVADLPDGETELPLAEVIAQRHAYVERIDRLFGTGQGWGPVYRPRDGREILGKTVGAGAGAGGDDGEVSLAVIGRREDQSVTVDNPEFAENYRPRAPMVPALLQRGNLQGIEPGERIAIAANDRIAAVGTAFDLQGETIYSILLPPGSLRPGENEIAVYALRGSPDFPRLQPL